MKKFIDLFKEKNNKIFTKVFLSYIIILLLPVVINIIMVTILTGTVRSEISDSSFLLTENLRVAADQILENVLKISRQINMNGSMTAMYEYDSRENIYNLKESIDFLNSITFNSDDISNIFVYNPHADIAISDDGRGNAESFFEKYYSGTEYSCEKLTQEISAVTDGGFMEVMSAEGDKVKYVEYRMPLMGTEIENVETLKGFPAFLIVRINQNLLDMSDAAKESYPAMQVFTLTGNERIIGTQPDFDIETGRLKSKTEDGGFKILKEKGIIYLCEKSSLTDWTYVTATSMLRYYREYFLAILFVVLGTLAILAVGLKLIMNFIKTNYSGFLEMVSSVKSAMGDNRSKADITEVQQYLNDIISNRKYAEAEIKNSSDIVKDNCIIRLLNGRIYDRHVYDELCAEMSAEKFTVVIYRIESARGLYKNSADEDMSEESKLRDALFIAENVLTELFADKYNSRSVYIRRSIAFVIGGDAENFEDSIYGLCREFSDYIEKQFNIKVSAAVGDTVDELKDILKSYETAAQAIQYVFSSPSSVIDYRGIGKRSDLYEITPVQRKSFENNLAISNAEECERILREIFDENIVKKSLSAEMTRGFIIEINDMITDAMLKGDSSPDISLKNKLLVELLSKQKIDETLELCIKTVRDYCGGRSTAGNVKSDELTKELKTYIDNNFSDKDINVSSVAEYAGMSRAYVSKIFKQSYNISILEYIHTRRIEKAAELLEGRGTINEIADKAGYASGSVFIQTFKKYMGVTPNQYRERRSNS